MMELEALQEVDSDVSGLGARTVAITPELERYTRAVHRKLNLTFDLLSDPRTSKSRNNSDLFLLCPTICGSYMRRLAAL